MTGAPLVGSAVARCRRVSAGATELVTLFGTVMPFAGDDLEALELVQRAGATAYMKRFEQLQDLISRAVRGIAGWEGADSSTMTNRDVGDWLEKRGIADDAAEWMTAVRLRNRLVHEYPIEEREQVRRLNECWSLMPLLQNITDRLGRHADQKGLV